MNNDKKNKGNGGRFKNHHRRHHNNNQTKNQKDERNTVTQDNTKNVKEEKKKIEKIHEVAFTRNLDNLEVGYRLPVMTLFNASEEEFNLNEDRSVKVYATIPTFENKAFAHDLLKLDTILKEFPSLNAYAISNEPVYTQKRLSKPYSFEKFRILSDFKNREFARNTGTYIYELSQLVKSVFIVDKSERILFVHYYDDLYSNFDLNAIHKSLKKIFE